MIVPYSELPDLRKEYAERRIVFKGGCFDLIHEGHIACLEFCRRQGDMLFVGICPDERVAERKGPTRPVRSEAGRLAVVNAFDAVDYAFIMPPAVNGLIRPTMKVIAALRPNVFVEEAAQAPLWRNCEDIFTLLGTEVVYDDQSRLDSTTAIIDRVLAGAAVPVEA